jgi:hypothetical protein
MKTTIFVFFLDVTPLDLRNRSRWLQTEQICRKSAAGASQETL